MSTNTITITGHLATDPELRYAQTGTAICNLSIPDTKSRKNDHGQWEDVSATTWFRVTLFKEAAEAFAEKARKGDEVIATGRLITREWTDKDGNTRSSLELDFAKVAIVPKQPRQNAQAGGWGGQQTQQQPTQPQQQQRQGDPWASGGAGVQQPLHDDPPF